MLRTQSYSAVTLFRRLYSFTRRWATYAAYSWQDLFEGYVEPKKRDRKRVWLTISPLEIRQMPSFGIALQAGAAPEPFQGTTQTVPFSEMRAAICL